MLSLTNAANNFFWLADFVKDLDSRSLVQNSTKLSEILIAYNVYFLLHLNKIMTNVFIANVAFMLLKQRHVRNILQPVCKISNIAFAWHGRAIALKINKVYLKNFKIIRGFCSRL